MTDSLLKCLKTQPTPFIDNDTVTFIWKGRTPPTLAGDFTGWDSDNPVKMVESEPGVWTYQLKFLPDAYIEYAFQNDEENILDPFNPHQTSNGIGSYNNYFSMPDYNPIALARKKRNIPHGTITTHTLYTDYVISGKKRAIHLYRPPVAEPVPAVVVWDGQAYLNRMHLHYIVDNLIYQKRIKPVALVFIDNGGQDLRTVEYACNDATLAFLMGFLRRDFGATGLFALQSQNLLTPLQTVVAMVTITLFIPCVAAVMMIARERGWRMTLGMTAFIFPFAFAVGGGLRLLLQAAGGS